MPVMFFMATMVLYLVGTAFFLAYLLRRSEALSKVSLIVTGIGFLAHTIALLTKMMGADHAPLTSVHEAMSFFSWALVLVFLIVEVRHRIPVLGSFILPLALISLISAAALPKEVPTLEPVLKTVWLHVTLSVLGTVGFAVAFVAGLMYLIQDGLLKSKRFNVLYAKLPPLDFLDHLNQQSIVLGFPLLTLGIITGALSAEFARGSYLNWNPEQLWALVTWVFYFVVLLGRLTVGWRAKRAAYLTIIGFAGVILTFIGVVLKGHGAVG
ncbi:MAG: c-type cytochrome biogenesis protein CcsB [Nitrospirae bacterium]|nr:MAG: c-type cytochrome biogenesis protein CcsB [Nitrospirota bacterium]